MTRLKIKTFNDRTHIIFSTIKLSHQFFPLDSRKPNDQVTPPQYTSAHNTRYTVDMNGHDANSRNIAQP